ncbi:MAG: 4-(cytidine 5'-diphospho)-2-C-methyl-D-erythritol kinase [bacterium]|nr:4-(cytidine 5'-diphospho)-2-C-methyl-D-erythritol kinase [bacterium]
MLSTYQIKSFAKLNLSLLVYSPRKKDLYHPICSIFQNISIYDKIEIITSKKNNSFELTCNHPALKDNESNIITKIYSYYKNKIPFGLKIKITKNIPVGGGLGGGSSNAAAFIYFLNTACAWNLSNNNLAKMGTRFGADIPFFFSGGTALVRGTGGSITPVKQGPYNYFVIIQPGIEISTQKIYAEFDKHLTGNKKPGRTPSKILKYHSGHNSLKSIVFSLYPELSNIEAQLINLNAPQLYMSGSGSTLFIPFKTSKDARVWKDKTASLFTNYTVTKARALNKGFEIINTQ